MSILAFAIDYYISPTDMPWQLPLLAAMVAGWFVVGGLLLRRTCVRYVAKVHAAAAQASHDAPAPTAAAALPAAPGLYVPPAAAPVAVAPMRRGAQVPSIGRTMLVFLVGSVAGAVLGGLMFALFHVLRQVTDIESLSIAGLAMAIIVGLPTLILAETAMMKFSFLEVARLSILPILAASIIAGGCLAACAIPARFIRPQQIARETCLGHLQVIDRAIRTYESQHQGKPPPNLDVLKPSEGSSSRPGPGGPSLLKRAEDARCPSASAGDSGYLYLPIPTDMDLATKKQPIRLADKRSNHPGMRNVILATGTAARPQVLRLSEEEFQAMLAKPENAEFKKLVEKEDR